MTTTTNTPPAPTPLEHAAAGVSYAVGRSVLGPLGAGALDSPDMRSASMSLGLRIGLSAGVGLALVYLVGRALR
jgi:hypothetical protein